jgi:ribosomal protein S19E (S16A)
MAGTVFATSARTAKGRGLMDNAAHAVRAEVAKTVPAIAKY